MATSVELPFNEFITSVHGLYSRLCSSSVWLCCYGPRKKQKLRSNSDTLNIFYGATDDEQDALLNHYTNQEYDSIDADHGLTSESSKRFPYNFLSYFWQSELRRSNFQLLSDIRARASTSGSINTDYSSRRSLLDGISENNMEDNRLVEESFIEEVVAREV